MKVAFIALDLPEYSAAVVNALAPRVDVTCFIAADEAATMQLHPKVHVRLLPPLRLRHVYRQVRMMRWMVQQIRALRPDVIHLQGGHFWFNLLCLPLLQRFPVVLTIHDYHSHPGDRASERTPLAAYAFAYRRASHIIVHSEWVKRIVMRELAIAANRVHVIPHIMLEDGGRAAAGDAADVLFFGRIWKYKGLEYLIAAQPLISRQVPDATLTIAGTGEEFSRYRRLMRDPERFRIINRYVSSAERAELFRHTSVVSLPYIEATQSGVLPLAYAYSKPVVATNIGGLPETIEDGQTGLLVPPADESALADAIVALLTNRDLARHMGANGRRKLLAECSAQVIAERTLQVYGHAAMSAAKTALPLSA